jgi:hypothetical protein
MSDFRVKVTVRNNRILRAIEALGFKSNKQFADAHQLCYQRISDSIGFRLRPITDGEWTEFAFSLSSALRCEPEDLWPEHMRHLKSKARSIEFSTDEEGVRKLAAPPENYIEGRDVGKLHRLIALLPERQGYVVAERFGILSREKSLEELGAAMGVGRERVRQIEAKGLRNLKALMTKHKFGDALEQPPSPNV